jgi:hypothetical protein
MTQKRKHISVRVLVISAFLLMNAVILNAAFTDDKKYLWSLLVSIPLLVVAIWSLRRKPVDD